MDKGAAKARKEQFEGQLRDLQKDISSLSQRLAIPTIVSTLPAHHRLSTSRDDVTVQSSEVLEDINKSFTSVGTRTNNDNKGEKLAALMQEAHLAKKERDDALYRLEQAKLELEETRKVAQEYARLKTSYEHLKQEFESVKVSLESSERIRKQQKELINLLQKSHSIAVAGDASSVLSFNSISTISQGGNHQDMSTASFAAENREWLKAAPTSTSHLGAGEGVAARRRRSSGSSTAKVHPIPTAPPQPVPQAAAAVPSQTYLPQSYTASAYTPAPLPQPVPTHRAPTRSATPSPAPTPRTGVNTSAATNNTAGTGGSSKVRRSSAHVPPANAGSTAKTSAGATKKKVKSKKAPLAASAGQYLPPGPMPSYGTILGQNASLVPGHTARTPMQRGAGAGSASNGAVSESILNTSRSSTGTAEGVSFAGTDLAAAQTQYLHGIPGYVPPSSGTVIPQQYAYLHQYLGSASPATEAPRSAGRPPRHPSLPGPVSHAAAHSAAPVHIPHVQHSYAPVGLQSSYQYASYGSTATDTPHGGGGSASHLATAPKTASSTDGSTAKRTKKRAPMVRRIPHAASPAPERKVRSQSAPATRPAHVSTFGSARRPL